MHTNPLPKICYVGINTPDVSPRDSVYLKGLRELGIEVGECVVSSRKRFKYLRLATALWHIRRHYDVAFVGYMSPLVVPVARLYFKKVVFNALNPLYDGIIVERQEHTPYSLKALWIRCVDFVSFHMASVILIETEEQKRNVEHMYGVPSQKLFRVFTSVDPSLFAPHPAIAAPERFTAVFRGYVSSITGVEYIVEAARLLKDADIDFVMLVRGEGVARIQALATTYALTNIQFVTDRLETSKLVECMLRSHVLLGQFGANERLDRTIQFKTVEALALGKAYVTGDTRSNRELMHTNVDCLLVRRADPKAITDALLMLRDDPALAKRLDSEARALYERVLAPATVAREIIRIIERI